MDTARRTKWRWKKCVEQKIRLLIFTYGLFSEFAFLVRCLRGIKTEIFSHLLASMVSLSLEFPVFLRMNATVKTYYSLHKTPTFYTSQTDGNIYFHESCELDVDSFQAISPDLPLAGIRRDELCDLNDALTIFLRITPASEGST